MHQGEFFAKRIAAAGLISLLAACGGGGGGGGGPHPVPATCAAGAALEVLADATTSVGRVAGAVALGCNGALSQVRWQQTGGDPVVLLSDRTQAISFEAERTGTYRFRVDALDAAGTATSGEATIAVVAAPAGSTVTARVDHALRMGQRGSLRAWPVLAAGDAVASVAWTQVDGPAVADLDTSEPQRLLFTAPAVERDARLRFRVTLTTRAGTVDSDEVSVVVEALPPPPAGQLFGDPPAGRVYPYRATGPYADRLVDCVYSPALYYSGGDTSLCRLRQLPLLADGAADGVPSVEAIMDRVLVSHDWLGAVFEQFLRTQDVHGDFRRLLGSVTAVVLGSHIRPSYYWSATGAIYIDAEYLWLTARQRDLIGEAPDYRLAYDDELNFGGPWRYTIGNAEAQLDFPPDSRAPTRDVGYLVYELGPLLYHELAHANDIFPAAARGALDPALFVYQAVPATLPSDRLAWSYPLASAEMFALAQVKFFGVAPTAAQKAYTPAQVAGFFRADRATDEYNYSLPAGVANSREDLAMLFEEFMMSYRHGVRRDVAFTTRILAGQSGADVIVAWGSRGRIGEATIRPRARQVLGEIAPWLDPGAVDTLPAPVAMRPGESWAANLNLLPEGTAARAAARAEAPAGGRGRSIERQMRRPYVVAPPLLR